VFALAVLAFAVLPIGAHAMSRCGPLMDTAPECQRMTCGADGYWTTVNLAEGTACSNGKQCHIGECVLKTTATLYPRYKILSVLYAPPGRVSSYVDYGVGSTHGTSTLTTESWRNVTSVEDKIDTNLLFVSGSITLTASRTWGGDHTHSVDFVNTTQSDYKVPGSNFDGIDHDYDQIWLWLNPQVNLTLYDDNVVWSVVSHVGQGPRVMFVYVGQLKGLWGFSQGELDALVGAGITPNDYQTILNADPFAGGSTFIDPVRFDRTPYDFQYEPVPTCADNPNAATRIVKLTATSTVANSNTRTSSYSVGVTVANSINPEIVSNHLKIADTFTWTDSTTTKDSDGTSTQSTLQFGQPFCTYQGYIFGHTYLDRVYRTYMFSLERQ
jgi:hypothetical protein